MKSSHALPERGRTHRDFSRGAGVWLGLMLIALPSMRAELWQTSHGERCEGRLSGVYGSTAIIVGQAGATQLSLAFMDDAGLARVADFVAARSAPPQWAASGSKVAKSLRGRLQVMREGKLVAYEPGTRPEPDFYLAYFGAHWCGPCREFSPDLVAAYRRLQQRAPNRFELIFVSSDRDADEQKGYIRDVGMPWPAVKYSAIGRVDPIERWAGPGIPCLVVLTRDGEMIFHSYHGTEYVGPRFVLQQFEELLRAMDGESPAARRAGHRLAVLQHLRAVGAGSSKPSPYLITFDPARYQTLEVKEVAATLEIDEHGCVTSAQIDPKLPTVLDYQLTGDAGSWLFLPAIKDGQPMSTKAILPLSFKR